MEREDDDVLETSARLLRLLSLLQARPEWPGPELADRLGVTDRTVRRDVDRLRQLGYPVDSAPGPTGGGYRLGAGGVLPPLLLDDDEAVAVTIGLQQAATAAGLEHAAASALRKLDQVLPPRLGHRVRALAAATVPLGAPTTDTAVDPETLVILAQACRGSIRLRFAYTDGRSRRTERTAEPYRLVHTGRRWYLVARDIRKREWRTFRVDRITEAEPTGHTFVLDDPPDAAALVSRAVSVAPYRHRAVVRVHAPAADLAERVPPTVGVVEAETDATSLLTTGSDHLESIVVHCAMLGFDLEVVEPPELRHHLRTLAERIARAAG